MTGKAGGEPKPLPYRLGAKAVIIRDGRVLLVGYKDETGLHYNFPGGGIWGNETIRDGLQREIFEETCARSRIGDLILVAEYFPQAPKNIYGPTPKLTLFFRAELAPGENARMPANPDPHQIEVNWFSLDQIPRSLLPRFYMRLVRQVSHPDIFTTDA
jgi:8-oxo-dGTP diphosphatase